MQTLSAQARPRFEGATPVPAGDTLFESLRSALVRFSRLVQSLEAESHTGYLSLLTDQAQGLVFFRDGRRMEAVYEGGVVRRGKAALEAIAQDVEAGKGVLDSGMLPGVVGGGLPGPWPGRAPYQGRRPSS